MFLSPLGGWKGVCGGGCGVKLFGGPVGGLGGNGWGVAEVD